MHYENTPMQKYRDFCFHIKMKISVEKLLYFPYFCSKHRLWVHVRTATVLTSTHNLCFGPKIRKKSYTPAYPVLPYKSRVEGGIHCTEMFPDGIHK